MWDTQRIGECLVLGLIPMTSRSSLSMAEFVTLRSLLALGTPRSPLVLSPVLRRTNEEKSPMAVFNGAFPILPGKEQAGRDFAAACICRRGRRQMLRISDTDKGSRVKILRLNGRWSIQG